MDSENSSLLVASEANNAPMLHLTTVVGTERLDSDVVFSRSFRIWVKVLRAFDCMLVQPTAGLPCLPTPSTDGLAFPSGSDER